LHAPDQIAVATRDQVHRSSVDAISENVIAPLQVGVWYAFAANCRWRLRKRSRRRGVLQQLAAGGTKLVATPQASGRRARPSERCRSLPGLQLASSMELLLVLKNRPKAGLMEGIQAGIGLPTLRWFYIMLF